MRLSGERFSGTASHLQDLEVEFRLDFGLVAVVAAAVVAVDEYVLPLLYDKYSVRTLKNQNRAKI